MKSNLTRLASLAIATTLAGCTVGGTSSTSSSGNSTTASATAVATAEVAGNDDILIGVIQLVQHDALDAATNGFVNTLKDELGLTDDNFIIDVASGEMDTCVSMANTQVQAGVNLIMANATPALLAAAGVTANVPILGTSVTEYGTAMGISDFNGIVGGNISGTSDLAPLDQQAAMFAELLPDAKNIGILYCSGEDNSKYQVEVVESYLTAHDYNVTLYSFTNTNDIAAVAQSAVSENDALYIPTDNAAASSAETIDAIALSAGVPIIAGEENIMNGCGIASLTIDYEQLGVTTAQMAIRVLNGEDISTMPIEYYANPVKKFNAERCEKLGIEVPSDYIASN